MSYKIALAVVLLGVSGAAEAQTSSDPVDAASNWTVRLTGSYAQAIDVDPEQSFTTGGVGLSYAFGTTTVGISVSPLQAKQTVSGVTAEDESNGLLWSGSTGWQVWDLDLDVSASYARDSLDGTGAATGTLPGFLAGQTVSFSGSNTSYGVSFGVAKTFDMTGWSLTPHARISGDGTKRKLTTQLTNRSSAGVSTDTDASGATFSGGLTGAVSPTDWLSFSADISGVATSSAAATPVVTTGRTTRVRTTDSTDDGSAAWAEASIGTTLQMGQHASLNLSGGRTAGASIDEAFGSATLSLTF